MPEFKKIPKKYHPPGFDVIYEDQDIIVGNKASGFLTVRALWNKEHTIHSMLNEYVRKGNSKSHKRVFVVHRLDQDTSGVLMFAKTEAMQIRLKDNWKNTLKTYYAVVHGQMPKTSGTISSYLVEDEDYVVHATTNPKEGRLSHTSYVVVQATNKFSLLKIDLLTGRKNQIRVHLADEGHPVVGDTKYGTSSKKYERLALHAQAIAFDHPFSGKRMTFEVKIPEYFSKLLGPGQVIGQPLSS